MNAFSGLNSRVNGGNKFTNIENQNGDDIANVFAANCFRTKHDGDGPPESETVHEKQRELR